MSKFKNKFVSFMTVVIVVLCMACSANAIEYDENVDYMAQMELAAISGDERAGTEAEAKRNQKIDDMGGGYNYIAWKDLYLLSKIVYAEAGSDWLSDRHQMLVGSVLLNRVNSPEFPNTMAECIHQPGQYYSKNSRYFANLRPSERAVRNASYLLANGSIAPASVVFQSNYRNLGSGTYEAIHDKYLGTSYFAYSNNPKLYK